MKTIDIVKDEARFGQVGHYKIYDTWVMIPDVFEVDLGYDPEIIDLRANGMGDSSAQMNKEQFGEFIQHLQELHNKMKP